jgi:hypothetical protein
MALVLAETAAGAASLLFLTPLWTEVRRGFFYLTGGLVLALAALSAGAAQAGSDPQVGSGGGPAVTLALVLGGTTLLWLLLMSFRAGRAARVLGIASVPLGVAMLYEFARAAAGSTGFAFLELLTGAIFTGAVLDGLLLGHWYLTDRRLPRSPINRMAWLLLAGVSLEAVAIVGGGFGADSGPGPVISRSLSPLLAVGGSAAFIALGMVACTGLIAFFIRLTLRGSRPTAVQSATGFFYLAVITALTAELAAKLRFLP